jgi:hypothetical protein
MWTIEHNIPADYLGSLKSYKQISIIGLHHGVQFKQTNLDRFLTLWFIHQNV